MGNTCKKHNAKQTIENRDQDTRQNRSRISILRGKRPTQFRVQTITHPVGQNAATHVAIWDYKAANKSELSLSKGDIVVQLERHSQSTNSHWTFVMRVSGDCPSIGYVPVSYLAKSDAVEEFRCNFGFITRTKAENVLKRTLDGTYLIRMQRPENSPGKLSSHTVDTYVLSIQYKRCAQHYRIFRKAEQGYFLEGDDTVFSSLSTFIDTLKKVDASEIVCCRLRNPAPKSKPRISRPLSIAAKNSWRELDPSKLETQGELYNGSYNIMYKAQYHPQRTSRRSIQAVVKQLRQPYAEAARERWLSEAVALKKLSAVSDRFLTMYGAITLSEPSRLVTEYMEYGTLGFYLRMRREKDVPVPLKQLLKVAYQIADAMRVLSNEHLVHRSLMAKHILVKRRLAQVTKSSKTESDTVSTDAVLVKIGGLGTCTSLKNTMDPVRITYGKCLPIKWTAPEVLRGHDATHASDVWSFGVTMHEIFTHGKEPYEGLSDAETRQFVAAERKILQRDAAIPETVYDIMKKCFKLKKNHRPSFGQLCYHFDQCDSVCDSS